MDSYDLAGLQALLDGLGGEPARRKSAASDLKFAVSDRWKFKADLDFSTVLPQLGTLLRGPDADLRTLAALVLRGAAAQGVDLAAVMPVLREALRDSTKIVRQDCARALAADAARRGSWTEIETLLVEGADVRVQIGVLSELHALASREIDLEAARRLVVTALGAKDPAVRKAAERARAAIDEAAALSPEQRRQRLHAAASGEPPKPARSPRAPPATGIDTDAKVPYLKHFSVIIAEQTYTLPDHSMQDLVAQAARDKHATVPSTSFITSVAGAAARACEGAPRHVARLLAAGTLGLTPAAVGEGVMWLRTYVAMHDGEPYPEKTLDDEVFEWEPAAGEIAGVDENDGRLAWWRCRIEPGAYRREALVWQELADFRTNGAPVPVPPDVLASLQSLVDAQVRTSTK